MAKKKIKIEGKFTNSVNRYVRLDVYRANPESYDFSKTYSNDFSEAIVDLLPNTLYFIDITGFTFGKFELKITGDFLQPNPLSDSYEQTDFKPGYTIQTT
jgi:hypothetical protein